MERDFIQMTVMKEEGRQKDWKPLLPTCNRVSAPSLCESRGREAGTVHINDQDFHGRDFWGHTCPGPLAHVHSQKYLSFS